MGGHGNVGGARPPFQGGLQDPLSLAFNRLTNTGRWGSVGGRSLSPPHQSAACTLPWAAGFLSLTLLCLLSPPSSPFRRTHLCTNPDLISALPCHPPQTLAEQVGFSLL